MRREQTPENDAIQSRDTAKRSEEERGQIGDANKRETVVRNHADEITRAPCAQHMR